VVERVFFPIFDMSIRSGDIRDQSRTLKKSTEFCMLLDPIFGEGGEPSPEFLEWDYKIQPASHHAAKFHGDRPRELGDPALKKTSRAKYKPVRELSFWAA